MTNDLQGAILKWREALEHANHLKLNNVVKPEVRAAIASIDAVLAAVPDGMPEDPVDDRRRYGGDHASAHAAKLLQTITARADSVKHEGEEG